MILPLCARCETCIFFNRFVPTSVADFEPDHPALIDDTEAALAMPSLATTTDPDMHEYGKCVRNPPQFFSASLEGEWPVIHRSRVCGEYRPNGCQN